jgi:hypothetical protein
MTALVPNGPTSHVTGMETQQRGTGFASAYVNIG